MITTNANCVHDCVFSTVFTNVRVYFDNFFTTCNGDCVNFTRGILTITLVHIPNT